MDWGTVGDGSDGEPLSVAAQFTGWRRRRHGGVQGNAGRFGRPAFGFGAGSFAFGIFTVAAPCAGCPGCGSVP